MATPYGSYTTSYIGQIFATMLTDVGRSLGYFIEWCLNWAERSYFQPDAAFSIALDRVQREGRSEQVRKASPFLAFIHRHLLHDEFVGDGFQSGAKHKLMLA